MKRFFSKYLPQEGQGLVEYALLLVLVSVVVLGILMVLGPTVGNVFTDVINALGGGSNITITKANYDDGTVHLDATVDGGYDPSVTLTASPGGVMEARKDHYHRIVRNLSGCPCTITVTSSAGGSATVRVGP